MKSSAHLLFLALTIVLFAACTSSLKTTNQSIKQTTLNPNTNTNTNAPNRSITAYTTDTVAHDRVHKDPWFPDLVEIIKAKKSETVLDTLRELKAKYPTYFNNYILAYQSLSIQDASFQNPRAILFGESARFILTFNGHQNQRGFAALEMMEFTKNKGFSFREIGFTKEGYKSEFSATEIDQQLSSDKIIVSKTNPQKCLQCHNANNPRPIWENYFLWPGMYGGEDDNVFRPYVQLVETERKDGPPASFNRVFKLVDKDIERDALIKFINTEKKTNERYALLGNYIESTFSPVNDSVRPNLDLLTNLLDLTYRKGAREILANKKTAPWAKNIIGAIECSYSKTIQEFLPKEMTRDAKAFNELYERTWHKLYKDTLIDSNEKIYRFQKIFGKNILLRPSDNLRIASNSPNMLEKTKFNYKMAQEVLPNITWNDFISFGFSDLEAQQDAYYLVLLKYLGINTENWMINLRRTQTAQDRGVQSYKLAYQLRNLLKWYVGQSSTDDLEVNCKKILEQSHQ